MSARSRLTGVSPSNHAQRWAWLTAELRARRPLSAGREISQGAMPSGRASVGVLSEPREPFSARGLHRGYTVPMGIRV